MCAKKHLFISEQSADQFRIFQNRSAVLLSVPPCLHAQGKNPAREIRQPGNGTARKIHPVPFRMAVQTGIIQTAKHPETHRCNPNRSIQFFCDCFMIFQQQYIQVSHRVFQNPERIIHVKTASHRHLLVLPPVITPDQRQHGAPYRGHPGVFPRIPIAFPAENLQEIRNAEVLRIPTVRRKIFQHKGISMGTLRPVNHPPAHRVFRRSRKTPFNHIVIAAHFRIRLECMKNAERPREIADQIPVLKIIQFIATVGSIIKNHSVPRIQFTDKAAHLLRRPVTYEVPCRKHQRRGGISGTQFPDDPAVSVELHQMIPRMIPVAEAFRRADGMKQFRRTVMFDMRFRQLEIIVEMFLLTDIPDQPGRLSILRYVRLRHEFRFDRVQKLLRRPAVPVAHGSGILGVHEIPLTGILQQRGAQFSPFFQRPELRAVVEGAGDVGGCAPVRIGIRHCFRKCLLENVVHADTEHEEIQTLFHVPVNFAFPVLQIPVFRLETMEAAVREIT